MRWLDSITDSNGREFEQTPGDNEEGAWRAAVHGVAKSQIQLSHRTITANSFSTFSHMRGFPRDPLVMCVLSCFSHVQFFVTPRGACGSSVRGILQARILEWVAIPSSGGSY